MTHDDQIERTRAAVAQAAIELEQLQLYESSRALSLALTNAQQAAMWHGWHEGEQGRYVSPYPTAEHSDPDDDEPGLGIFLSASAGMPMEEYTDPERPR